MNGKEIEQIIYVASHDLRSPLVNIQGFNKELNIAINKISDIIKNENMPQDIMNKLVQILEEDIQLSLNYILSSTKKIDALLSGLLRLSRLGRDALEIKQLNMNKIIL